MAGGNLREIESVNSYPIAQEKDATPAEAPRIMPGRGVRPTVNEVGMALSAPTGGGKFGHPFMPSLFSGAVSFAKGLVDIYEPTIGGRRISDSRARLKLDPAKVNKNGESFVLIEVEPDAESEQGKQGILTPTARVEMVQDAEPDLFSETIGRQPVALIIFKGKTAIRAFPILFFNVRYERVKPAPGGGRVRHLFR
jgi:hypothetical protein